MKWQLHNYTNDPRVFSPRAIHGTIPVFVAPTGTYPEFISEAGESSKYSPHVRVSITVATIAATNKITSVSITAVGSPKNGYEQSLPIIRGRSLQEEPSVDEINAVIDGLSSDISNAISVCKKIDEIFDDARQRIEEAEEFAPACITREGYESACSNMGVDTIPDEKIIDSHWLKYGNFTFPSYSPEKIIRMRLAGRRLLALEAEAEADNAKYAVPNEPSSPHPAEAIMTGMTGQIWQPCPYCGREPIYMPLNICQYCWPKQ